VERVSAGLPHWVQRVSDRAALQACFHRWRVHLVVALYAPILAAAVPPAQLTAAAVAAAPQPPPTPATPPQPPREQEEEEQVRLGGQTTVEAPQQECKPVAPRVAEAARATNTISQPTSPAKAVLMSPSKTAAVPACQPTSPGRNDPPRRPDRAATTPITPISHTKPFRAGKVPARPAAAAARPGSAEAALLRAQEARLTAAAAREVVSVRNVSSPSQQPHVSFSVPADATDGVVPAGRSRPERPWHHPRAVKPLVKPKAVCHLKGWTPGGNSVLSFASKAAGITALPPAPPPPVTRKGDARLAALGNPPNPIKLQQTMRAVKAELIVRLVAVLLCHQPDSFCAAAQRCSNLPPSNGPGGILSLVWRERRIVLGLDVILRGVMWWDDVCRSSTQSRSARAPPSSTRSSPRSLCRRRSKSERPTRVTPTLACPHSPMALPSTRFAPPLEASLGPIRHRCLRCVGRHPGGAQMYSAASEVGLSTAVVRVRVFSHP
jgi:hypothetical protein